MIAHIPPWFKVYSLLLTTPGYFSVVVTIPCSEEAYRQLYPCGNVALYRRLTGDKGVMVNFVEGADYCYFDSKKVKIPDQTWSSAERKCKERGAKLAEFPTQEIWNMFLATVNSKVIIDRNAYYWTGGKRINSAWRWSSSGIIVSNFHWKKGQSSSNLVEHCLVMTAKGQLWTLKCTRKMKFLCQKGKTEAYNRRVTLKTIPGEKNGPKDFPTGLQLNITCSAMSQSGLDLSLVTRDHGRFSVVSNEEERQLTSGLGLVSFAQGVHYQFENERCFPQYTVSLLLTVTTRIHKGSISCSHLNKKFGSLSAHFTLSVHYTTKKPVITIYGIPENRQLPSYNDRLTYACQARFGLKEGTMTFVVQRGDIVWGISISYHGKETSVGRAPPGFDKLVIKHTSGNDSDVIGHYMNITTSFILTYAIKTTKLGCYSGDVLHKIEDGEPLQTTDNFSQWIDFNKTAYVSHAHLTIDLPRAIWEGGQRAIHCDIFTASCLGSAEKKSSLSFTVRSGDHEYAWRFGTPSNLPVWVRLKATEIIPDQIYGPSFKITFELTVRYETSGSVLICMDDYNKNDPLIKKKTLNLDFDIHVTGNLPPVMTSNRHPQGEQGEYLILNCTSHVGRGAIQSWKILDVLDGTEEVVKVRDKGQISRITLPWLSIRMLKSKGDTYCGLSISSELRVLKTVPKNRLLSLSCHSYDVHNIKFGTSGYTLRELTASYMFHSEYEVISEDDEILEDDVTDIKEMAVFIAWIVVLLLSGMAISVMLYLFNRRTKRESLVYDLSPLPPPIPPRPMAPPPLPRLEARLISEPNAWSEPSGSHAGYRGTSQGAGSSEYSRASPHTWSDIL